MFAALQMAIDCASEQYTELTDKSNLNFGFTHFSGCASIQNWGSINLYSFYRLAPVHMRVYVVFALRQILQYNNLLIRWFR